jgi:hypothetical protein
LVFDHQISDNLCYSISVPDSSEGKGHFNNARLLIMAVTVENH